MPDHPLILTREGPVASIQIAQPKTLNAITLRRAFSTRCVTWHRTIL
jgi:hypothetical protein